MGLYKVYQKITIFFPFPIEIVTEKLENSQILLCDNKNYLSEIKNLFAWAGVVAQQ